MDTLTCLLMDTAKLLKNSLTKSLKPFNLTCRQAIVVRALENESLSAKSIGDSCAMDKATLSVILDKLISVGYVSCEQNENDKRENAYSLTEEGKGILPNISTIETSCSTQLLGVLSEQEYENMITNLNKISDSLK